MSFNLCHLPKDEKYQIQLDYEASFWAFQVKRGKSTKDSVYGTILQRSVTERDYLKQRFEYYLLQMA